MESNDTPPNEPAKNELAKPPENPDQAGLAGILAQSAGDAASQHAAESPPKRGRGQRGPDKSPRKLPPQNRPRVPASPAAIDETFLAQAEASLSPAGELAVEEVFDEETAKAIVDLIVDGWADLRAEIVRFAAKRITGDDKIAEDTVKPVAPKLIATMKKGGFLMAKEQQMDFKHAPKWMFFGPMLLTLFKDGAKLKMLKAEVKAQAGD